MEQPQSNAPISRTVILGALIVITRLIANKKNAAANVYVLNILFTAPNVAPPSIPPNVHTAIIVPTTAGEPNSFSITKNEIFAECTPYRIINRNVIAPNTHVVLFSDPNPTFSSPETSALTGLSFGRNIIPKALSQQMVDF